MRAPSLKPGVRDRKTMKKSLSSASALAGYLRPLFEKTDPASPIGRAIADWCWRHQWVFGVDLAKHLRSRTKSGFRKYKYAYGKGVSKSVWKKLLVLLVERAAQADPCPIVCNAGVVAEIVDLDALDAAIFKFASMATGERALSRLLSSLINTRLVETPDLIASMTGEDATVIEERLAKGTLRQLDFVDGVEERPGQFELYVPYKTMTAVRSAAGSRQDIEHILLGAPARASLKKSDFDYIARERDFMLRLLKGAHARKERGVNILLYGPPGVGKTEFAKVLAHGVGCDLFVAPERDEYNEELHRDERLSSLCVADRLARKRGAAVLLFDEMEDLLSGGAVSLSGGRRIRRAGSKAYLNRMLELNETPIVWTTNAIDEFDPAFLRRMIFSMEMKTPPAAVRSTQWRRIAKRSGVKISRKKANELAGVHAAAPSFAQTAARAVATAGGGDEELDFVVRAVTRPIGGTASKSRKRFSGFDLALANADCDLDAIEDRLRAPGCPHDISFCLYGPPGTGKSALARHLGECLRLDTLEKRGADLLSPWVGETEQKIAAAFEEAASEKKLLLIDEAETLFWKRTNAARSWEASMVNEFLVNLDEAATPVVCSTNHLDRVDPAALRRFTFKVKLDYLTAAQAAAAFEKFFGMAPPDTLTRCDKLTPGDFAVVKKQLRFHPADCRHAPAIARMLEAEAAVKQEGAARIGF